MPEVVWRPAETIGPLLGRPTRLDFTVPLHMRYGPIRRPDDPCRPKCMPSKPAAVTRGRIASQTAHAAWNADRLRSSVQGSAALAGSP